MVIEDMQSLRIGAYGAIIAFSTNSSTLMEEVRKDFGIFETCAGLKTDGTMRIIEQDSKFPLTIPKYAIREKVLPPDSSIFKVSDTRFLEEKEKRILRIDLNKNNILGYFKPPCKISMLLRFLLKWMLIKALEKKGVAFIHGSGVEKDGCSLLFTGPSGFGKTHTLISLLLQDYNLITDDTIFFGNEMVLPFHIRSRITIDMFKKFPILKKGLNNKSTHLPASVAHARARPVWLINLGDIFPTREKEIQPSKLFYIYVWNALETKVELIPRKEMLARLFHVYNVELSNSMWFNHDKDEAMRNIFYNYDTIVKNADCYIVYAGSDPAIFQKSIQATLE